MSRVLLVDDQDALRDTVRLLLEDAGHDLIEAASGDRALDLLGQSVFDVVLSDISMPGLDGLGLLKAVHERDPDLPVILMTGAPTLDTAMEAVQLGALRYLTKPFDPDELIGVVEEASRTHVEAREVRAGYERDLDRREADEGRVALAAALDRAIESLWLAYQPIVRWSDRSIYGWEALLRSEEPELPNPVAVLEAAKQLGRLERVSAAVRERAAKTVDELPEGTFLFVNLDPDELDDPALYAQSSPLAAVSERVVLEITERPQAEPTVGSDVEISRLRGLGYRIAIDDLGAGYSALTRFAKLSPEIVKVDMSIVRDVHLHPTKARLIESLAAICREGGVDMIVEGIETPEERDKLVELGCDLLQGYLFARPERTLAAGREKALAHEA